MRRRKTSSDAVTDLNMTPLIDMIFILLIFFMVTSSFVREAGVEVERPTATTATAQAPTIILGIDASNVLWLEGKSMDIRSVPGTMAQALAANPETAVVIAADTMSRSGIVIEVMDLCRRAGVKNVSVATKHGG